MFFFGTFEHSIDERGRLAIPARYRRAFVDGGVLRVGPESCLEMYTEETFNEEVERRLSLAHGNRSTDARRIRRGFLSEAYSVDIDKQGRILVPPHMRSQAGLSGKVLVIGCGDYLELWHPERWAAEQAQLEAHDLDEDN